MANRLKQTNPVVNKRISVTSSEGHSATEQLIYKYIYVCMGKKIDEAFRNRRQCNLAPCSAMRRQVSTNQMVVLVSINLGNKKKSYFFFFFFLFFFYSVLLLVFALILLLSFT